MTQKNNWLPIDERLIPDIVSFTYPKNKWVRMFLFLEMCLAVLAVIATLVLTLLPRTDLSVNGVNAALSTQNSESK